ncbi:hydroxysqualene dehydroxylase HpnE [Rhizobacter sp. Root1221]|uniref:hydroxysqualene dehydroxylase HpnE n=1 Tax=Rhizobacter sp. Root1221 TaxID=1736433 RepID=UPI0006F3F0DA|nr:hydroxysqualene dehydroxylase HpnE [Rhizobacter sp. Root1221]KQV98492.1 phytoene dehydrogenase [Rhizobacter sp. Root1221]
MAKVAVIGGGWAGLAAAVHATRAGQHVTVFEMAPRLGGRARQIDSHGLALDNGQHILIGAYTETLALMQLVGVDLQRALKRTPLRIAYPDGTGLQMPAGSPLLAFARGVWAYPGWTRGDKWALLSTATRWALQGFRCPPSWTVARLTRHLPASVRDALLDPLCVAALNTPAPQASAQVFLRVLKDALFSGPGSADLLLPRWKLSALWPDPAGRWLAQAGAAVHLSRRVDAIAPSGPGWLVDGEPFEHVVLACTATEAARLAEPHAPDWATAARSLQYEPIVTVYAHSPDTQLPQPMLALRNGDQAPAQFVFDLGALSGMEGVLAFVISGAAPWVARGGDATLAATLRQGQKALAPFLRSPLVGLRAVTEKRATFLCTPGLARPGKTVLPGLSAAGDYIDGPYPATLEGAIRSGRDAANTTA